MLKNRKWTIGLVVLVPLIYLILSIAVVLLVSRNGSYPGGADTMYHIYRGDAVYKAISGGDFWFSLDPAWYNGAELLRYESPLPAYIMAACIALAGGNPLNGYLIFVLFLCFFGAVVWFYIGVHTDRPLLGALLGALWFVMPNNLYTLFTEGDLAFSLSAVFLPLLIYAINKYLESPKWTLLPLITISFLLIVLCSVNCAVITAVSVFIFSVIYIIITRRWRDVLDMFLSVLAAFLIAGIWLFASICGSNGFSPSLEALGRYFQNLWTSINPFDRFASNNTRYYFGMAALALAVFGAFCSIKKSMANFWTAIVIFLCSSSSMYAVISFLPGGESLQMTRFFSVAVCMILFGFLMWDTLKKPIALIAFLLVCLDAVPSLSLVYGTQSGVPASDRLDEQQSATLISQAQEITTQRLALLDASSLDSMGAMLVSDWNNPVDGTYGANAKYAQTFKNISQLDAALANGNFLYMFDRCMELGNDTVVVRSSQINTAAYSLARLDDAAARVGYNIITFNDDFRLYHMDIEGSWGTTAKYKAIGIGSAAASISLTFPAMEETDSANLNDYTFEQLKDYELVYLAGFTYDDRESAEDLVVKLSESGVRVVIAADGIPQDSDHSRRFLGVTCNDIAFSNGYPELDTIDGLLNTDLFPTEYSDWQTVYLEGLDETWGTVCESDDLSLDFYGTVKNDNIVMIGINLTYFYGLTDDASVGELLGHAMTISSEDLPQRTAVPLKVTVGADSIKITSPEDGVNTSLAFHDTFESEQEIKSQNNLLYVQRGDTVISLNYPYFIVGLIISTVGILLTASLYIFVRKRLKPDK